MSTERRKLSWRTVVGYIVLFTIVGALAAAIIANANAISNQIVKGCFGGSARTVQQLKVDYAIYTADRKAAAGKSNSVQAQIRSQEADELLVYMKKIAAVRIDYRLASLLPESLASVVTSTGFDCNDVGEKLL